ncbi:FadR/GntR family transcriptional regulator [Aneurinibacillus uraniidurans]|uniref:FadR/GntR family transcriptional regulator n=1 Tax=Aneurinibacillus uraniidurans TaxID=2966586 RepID=UPI002349F650|nr:FadR/GntR family transcriptional regulator [Aneurinibacillus sp. B1]WCN38273.1 FadR/GntR family transcriptional regulator [Aneurinibacillus sp. B1]
MKTVPMIRTRKTYEEVTEYLRELIVSGGYMPGEQLPSLRELKDMLGVSQSTIREALSSLKTMGLIIIKQGEGTFVTQYNPEELLSAFEAIRPVTRQDIISLLEVRKIIESGTAKLAAERRTDGELLEIEKALSCMKQALENGELGHEADWKFHYAVARASHNHVLESVMLSISETMETALRTSRMKLYTRRGNPEALYQEHVGIYEAIRAQNVNKAEEAMLYHLVGVEKKMLS